MSDFFGGLTGGNIRFTDSRIDGDGPLPTSLSGPEGINGDPDGRYNFNDSLLSGITPYAYGQGRMGSDRNYQQIPNRKQFPVPPLWLPEPAWNTETTLEVSHSVDMGDIAFICNVHHKQFMLSRGPFKHENQDHDHTLPQWNVFCNICTVNYLLAGLHNYAIHCAKHNHVHHSHHSEHAWYRLFRCFKIYKHLTEIVQNYDTEKDVSLTMADEMLALRCYLMLQQVVKLNIIPIGICSMSEKQGGQHEIGSKPVQAACNFFTTLTVDGQNRDLVNIWRAVDVEAGDFLTLQLEFCKEHHTKHLYVLNHYYKDTVSRTMSMHNSAKGRIQLIPDVFKMKRKTTEILQLDNLKTYINYKMPIWSSFSDHLHEIATDLRYSGYWHIGQTYNKKQYFTNVKVPVNDMEMTKGQLLQINFAPVWKGTMYSDDVDSKTVDLFPAYALQVLMFGKREMVKMFVDVAVSSQTKTSEIPRDSVSEKLDATNPAQKKFRSSNNQTKQSESEQSKSDQSARVPEPAAAVVHKDPAPAPLQPAPAPIAPAAAVVDKAPAPAALKPAPAPVANQAAGAPASSNALAPSIPAAPSIAKLLDEVAESASVSNGSAEKAQAATSQSTWDFETEIENMLAAEASTVKPKKTKTAKANNTTTL